MCATETCSYSDSCNQYVKEKIFVMKILRREIVIFQQEAKQ